MCLRAYSYKTRALLEANKLSYPIVQTRLLGGNIGGLRYSCCLVQCWSWCTSCRLSCWSLAAKRGQRKGRRVRVVHLNTWLGRDWLRAIGSRGEDRLPAGLGMMGVPGGPPPPDAPYDEANALATYTLAWKTSALYMMYYWPSSNVEIFLPHMRQEREMSKASEKTKQRQKENKHWWPRQ